jgi:flagellar M-ring protein FliF
MENIVHHPAPATSFPAIGLMNQLSPRAKAMYALGMASLVAIVTAAWLWSTAPNYGVLFTNVSDRDGGAIVAQLAQMNVPYRMAEGGVIQVPAEKVAEVRLRLATLGLPKGSIVGFELMENQKFGQTQFQEQLNYQRGLEGELARSIQTLSPVANARVHLALPRNSGFLRDKEPPTASIIVSLHPGQTLERAQVAGIVHLVASSVPNLNTKNVSIVDQQGNLLANQGDSVAGLDSTQLDYLTQVENATIKRIEDILEPLVGRGNVRARVTADVDFSNTDIEDETYAPNQGTDKVAIRSQSSTDSGQNGADKQPGGIPGALSNQPPGPAVAPINGSPATTPSASAALASSSSAHHEQTTNYEVSKNIRRTHAASGQIRRLTAAVIINNKAAAKAANGTMAPATPWDKTELDNLRNLVQEAMGYDEKRGDALNLVNAAFTSPDLLPSEPTPFMEKPEVVSMAKQIGQSVLFLALTLIVVFGVLRPAVKAMNAPRKVTAEMMPDGSGSDGMTPALPAPSQHVNQGPLALDNVRQIAKSDPAAVANVVKQWVGENSR